MELTESPEGSENGLAVAGTSQVIELERLNPYTITEDMLRKRLQHENKGRFSSQLCCALTASLAALSFGAMLGWSSSATRHLKGVAYYNYSEDTYGWIASLMPLGCSVGIVPWSYGINTLGPKYIMVLQTPFYILVILLMVTVKTFRSYIVGRFFAGFLAISYLMGGERLLTDSVHTGYLSVMLVCFRVSVFTGILMSYIAGHLSTKIWLTVICAAIPLINIAFLCIVPESPVFLYDKSERKAEKALCWYRGRKNVYMALKSIKKDSEIRKIGTESYMLYSKVVVKALSIIIGLNFFRVFSGYYAFIFYNLLFWEEFSLVNQSLDTIIFGSCLCVSNLIGNIFRLQASFGVRKPLLISCSLIAFNLTILTLYSILYDEKIPFILSNNWIPVAAVNVFVFSYEIGLGKYPDIILYDYLPFQVHIKARSITQVLYWFQVFLLVKYIVTIRTLTTHYISLMILSVISYISILYCYQFVIETKGKNLMQIQMEFGGNPVGNRGAYRHRREATYRQGAGIN